MSALNPHKSPIAFVGYEASLGRLDFAQTREQEVLLGFREDINGVSCGGDPSIPRTQAVTVPKCSRAFASQSRSFPVENQKEDKSLKAAEGGTTPAYAPPMFQVWGKCR